MKKSFTGWRALLVGVAIIAASGGSLVAQTTGEYRSSAPTPTGGNWSSAATWQTWNGTSWVTASAAPTGTEPKITIQSTDSVYVDAAVTITDTLDNKGILNGGSSLTFGNGGVYQHDQNGGVIPSATWNSGSTCSVTGVTSSAPGNANQSFYNFTWDCAGQTSSVNVAWDSVSIAGNVSVLNTNDAAGIHWFRFTSNKYGLNPSGPNIITIGGNLSISGGSACTATGSGTPAHYIRVLVNGNLSYTGSSTDTSSFQLGNGSGGQVNFIIKGNVATTPVAHGQFSTNSSSTYPDSLIFAGTNPQTFSNSIASLSNIKIAVYPGAILSMDGSNTMGTASSTTFTLFAGGTFECGATSGLNGNITVGGAKSLNSSADYAFDGSSAQTTGTLLPATVRNLMVDNSAGVTLTQSVSADTLTLSSGKLNLDTNYVMASVVSGASATSYAVTDSSKSSFMVPNVGSAKVIFPVGTTAEGYSPVWMTNAGTVDTFAVAAMMDTAAAVGGGRVNVKWNVSENNPGGANCALTFGWTAAAENAAFTADRAAYAQIYNLSAVPYRQAGTGTYTSQLATAPYTLSRGAIVSLGSFGVGKFGLAVNPLVGDYGSVATGNWSSLSTWRQWDGTGWNTVAAVVPTGAVNVFVNKADTVTVDVVDSVGGNIIVDGYLKDVAGLKTGGATVIFDSASTYELAHNGGAAAGIPSATWKTGSTCLITGASGSISSTTGYNANQDFYNLTIDAAFTANKDLAMFGNTINGMLKINNTGGSRVYLTSPGAGTPNTITVKGNLLLTAGQFSSNGSSSPADITVNSYGNITATGGNFSISRGSGPVVRWNSYGDTLSLSNATTQTSGSNDAFVFAKQGSQYLSLNSVTFGSGSMPVEVDTGATLLMGTNKFEGNAAFAIDSGAIVECGDTNGVSGNIATTGTVTISPGASFVLNGAVAQFTGSKLSGTIRNLTIDNSKGVTLSDTLKLNGTLTMTDGVLMLDTNTVTAASTAGGSPTSYVSTDTAKSYLAISNLGSTRTLFPVGTTAEGYSPVWITNAGTADTYTIHAAMDTATVSGGGRVNVKWDVGEGTPGGSNLTMQFGWMASAENSVFSANRAANALIYYLTDTTDTQAGSGRYSTEFSTEPYAVSRGGIATVGTFGVGNFTTTGVNEAENVPLEFRLYQNYPNPFNPTTKIEFTVVKKGMASVTIYNILGQHVATLYSGEAQPGKKYFVDFNASSLASGVYFSVLQSSGQRQIQKMVLMK